MAETVKGWAILELMGHRRLGGELSEVTIAGANFIRIDVPWRDASKGLRMTQFYPPSAVYCITPTDELSARAVAAQSEPHEIKPFQLTDGDDDPVTGRENNGAEPW